VPYRNDTFTAPAEPRKYRLPFTVAVVAAMLSAAPVPTWGGKDEVLKLFSAP
jgi:hypothetical protein